jgi:hypothetical protein
VALILVVENEPSWVLQYQKAFGTDEVVAVEGLTTDDLISATIAWFNTNPSRIVDFLFLDIHYEDDEMGGVLLHRELLENGYRKRIRHVILPTKWFSQGGPQIEKQLRTFMISSLLPPENCVPKDHELIRLRQRVDELRDKPASRYPVVAEWQV